MMEAYQPEIGQAAFGQPWQAHAVPAIMEAALAAIREEHDRIWWNCMQGECPSPFSNSGSRANFKSPIFEVCAYSWNDDEQPYNFAWRDLRISWYKHCGRGTSSNIPVTPDMAAQCLDECLDWLRRLEPAHNGDDYSAFKSCHPNISPTAQGGA
ncbi:hypothetical protein [Aestuariivirga sp.]|uniref:hypothetical protein n=1 Tax=Aestuariivirga sp. TaxID=2650926 RepID=UPI0039E54F9E